MHARASIRSWGETIVVQEQRSWRVLEWPSAEPRMAGGGTFVPGPQGRWASISDGVLTTDAGRKITASGAVTEAIWDGANAMVIADSGDVWRLDFSAGRHRLASDAQRPRIIGDRVGFERTFTSMAPGVALKPPDVRRTYTVPRVGGVSADLMPDLDGWVYRVEPSPTDPARLAFIHTDLPGPYTFRVGLFVDGRHRFPSYPYELTRLGSEPVWAVDGSAILSVGMQGIRAGVAAWDRDGNNLRWIAPPHGVHRSPVHLADGSVLSIWQDLDTPPAIVHTNARKSRRWAALDERPDWWPSVPIRLARWQSGEDQLEGLIATPPGNGPFPTIVDVHGGPDGMTQEASLSAYAVPLTDWVDAGFAVFAPDYRDSGILGLAAKRAAERMEPGQRASHDDVIAGIDHLVRTGIADPDRLYLFGFSMGGLAGGHVIARDRRIRAAAFWDPAGVDPGTVDNSIMRRQLGGSPTEVPDVWDRVSLLPLAQQTQLPVLIMSSGDPTSIPKQAHAKWHSALPSSRHLHFPDEGHVPTDGMRTEIVRLVTTWFCEHTSDR